jgi:pimeloyl-ACP methyl ester carboxylesterase
VATPVSDRFAKLLPASRLKIIPDCGHFPLTDDVAGSVAAILEFSQVTADRRKAG